MYFSLAMGFVLLMAGGEVLVRGASRIAVAMGISPLVIGIVIVGFGTSTPELVASVQAALAGAPDIAVGNIVGSNIANILLILGVSAVLCPIAIAKREMLRDGGLVVATAVLLAVAGHFGGLTRPVGTAFVIGLAGYMWFLIFRERRIASARRADGGEDDETPRELLLVPVLLAAAGVAGVVYGGKLLVDGAVWLARTHNIGEDIIGLTVVAIGTSLPELATSVAAALKKHSDIAIGNVLGSNVYNILGIGGITALVSPLAIPPQLLVVDIPLMIALSVALVLAGLVLAGISRTLGFLCLAGYSFYVAALLA